VGVNFSSIEIARSGLFVSGRGLFVTGHNLSNVNTAGYVRQQAIICDATYRQEAQFQVGLGADIQKIRQIRHSMLDNVYRQESQSLGYWEARQKTFDDIQAIIGEPLNKGLQSVMNDYWDSWQELSKQPDSLTTRALVRQRAESMVQYINNLGNQLDRMQNDLDSEIKLRIEEVNTLTSKIAKLNVNIVSLEATGDTANDLRDERNLCIDRLSKLVDCDVNEMQDGQIDITVGGYFLVNKGDSERLKTVANETGSLFSAPALERSGTIVPIKSGILKGLMESRGEVMGSKGSFENGCPNDKVDLIFAFNTNDTADQRDNLYNNIDSIVKDYTRRGIGVRLGFVTFDHTGMTSPTTFESVSLNAEGVYVPDIASFKSNIGSLSFSGAGVAGDGVAALQDAENAANNTDALTNWRNTSKQIVLFTDSGMNTTGLAALSDRFGANMVRTQVVSNSSHKSDLGILAERSGDRFVESDTSSGLDIMDGISESIRNSIYGNVSDTNNIIPDIKNRLNLLISALVREVNSLHKSGITLDGNPGEDFFVTENPYYPIQMGNIKINPNLTNLNNIVSSFNGSVGDNTVAVDIANLRHNPLLGPTGIIQNMDDFYRSLIGKIGNEGEEAHSAAEGQSNLVNSADNFRLAIMNVSMDEEMSYMMKYQFAYNAAARILNIFDEMYDSIVNRLGLVGR